jgi:tetratricopeptide (TPR) repeat protein
MIGQEETCPECGQVCIVPRPTITDRVVRVFISSTFSDMHAERDELAKRVFPQLRKLCEDRGIIWTDVDLRWGITQEQIDEGKVLPICLAEVNNCRPFFIGMLGERYGSLPKRGDVSDDLIAEQPWLAERTERSVTELEILHGVMNDPAMANRACFYFRDPAYVETVPSEDRNDFVEPDPSGREKLSALKDSIRDSGLALRENYSDPQALADMVLADLTAAIDEEFPPGSEPDPLDAEAVEHEAFAVSRARIYIGRDEYYAHLDEHASGEGPPLVIEGDSGSGKSALLANWALQYRRDHAHEPLLMHFIGASAYSADWAAMLRRIMGELKRLFNIDGEIPTNPDDLRAEFANWLQTANARGRVVLMLDALNQLEDRDQALDLVWLPEAIPVNIRLIVSTLPGRSNDVLARRGWPTMRVELLTDDERRRFIDKYLTAYTRSLDENCTDSLASAAQAANPLYLQTLLDELRIVGEYDRLGKQIDEYLTAADVPQLYEKILDRYQEDYDRDRPGLVRDAMTLIWAARRGLSEPELLDMLGEDGDPMPRAHWSLLHFAADRSLVTRSGLINFSHDHIRQAVANFYLPTDADRHAAHLRLADYFTPRDLTARKIDEMPWQLSRADNLDRLKDCIVDLDVFLNLHTDAKKYELRDYWLQLDDAYDKVTEYTCALDACESSSGAGADLALRLSEVGLFLNECAEYTGAEPLYRRALSIDEASFGPNHPAVATVLNNLALLLVNTNRHAEAEPLYRRALEINEVSLGPDHPNVATGLSNLAGLLYVTNRHSDAEALYRRALAIDEASFGPGHLNVAFRLNNLAELLRFTNHHSEAEPLFRRALAIVEAKFGLDHPEVAAVLNNLAALLELTNRHSDAEPLYRRALAIDEASFGPNHPNVALRLNNLAALLKFTNRHSDAEPLYRRALSIDEASFGADHPNVAIDLNNLAGLFYATNRHSEAEPLFRRTLAIFEASFGPDHPNVATGLSNLATLLELTNRCSDAEPLHRRALTIDEASFGPDHPNVALRLMSLANLLRVTNRHSEAEPLYHRALAIDEASFGPNHRKVAVRLNNLAMLLSDTNRHSEAEPLYRRALAINEASFGPNHPEVATGLNNLAALLKSTNRHAEAEPLYRRALTIDEASFGPDHPNVATGLNNLAALLKSTNRHAEAEPLYRRALTIDEASFGPDHPNVALRLNNLAGLLKSTNRHSEAEPLYRRALAICETSLGPDHTWSQTFSGNLEALQQEMQNGDGG